MSCRDSDTSLDICFRFASVSQNNELWMVSSKAEHTDCLKKEQLYKICSYSLGLSSSLDFYNISVNFSIIKILVLRWITIENNYAGLETAHQNDNGKPFYCLLFITKIQFVVMPFKTYYVLLDIKTC